MTRLFVLFCCSFLIAGFLPGQETNKLPRFASTTITTDVSVPDGGPVWHRSSPPKSSREILAAARVENQRCSKTEIDGITTYDIIHENKPLTLVIYPDGKIEMTIVREFNADKVDELRADFPDLIMDFNAFPKTTSPDSRVRLNLEIETKYIFVGPGDLEQNRPDLYRIYHQYTRPPVITWSK